MRPALCEGPSKHMREYYLRCLVESLLAERLREAAENVGEGRVTTASFYSKSAVSCWAKEEKTYIEGVILLCSPAERKNHRCNTLVTFPLSIGCALSKKDVSWPSLRTVC